MNKAKLARVFNVTLTERIGPLNTHDAQLYNNNAYVYRFSKPVHKNAANLELKIAKKAAEKGIAPQISNSVYKDGILMMRMEKMDGNLEELTKKNKKLNYMPAVKFLIGVFKAMGY